MQSFVKTCSGSLLALALLLFLGFPMEGSSQKEKGKKSEKKESPKKKRAERPASDLEVSKQEMKKLVRIDQKLQKIQIRTQKKMKKNIERSGIGTQRFNEIRRAQKSGDNPDMTKKEKEQMKKLRKMNKKTKEKMMKRMKEKVKAEGMSFARYKELRKAISRNPELRGRYRKHMKAQQNEQRRKKKRAPKKKESPDQ